VSEAPEPDPVEVLTRWEAHGAIWRVRSLSGTEAVVDLCTCYGDPVDELRSGDPELLAFLAARSAEHVEGE
jgi:hypothetical protein